MSLIYRDRPNRHEVVTGNLDDVREKQGERKSILEENRHLKP